MHLEIVYTVFLGKMIFLEIKKISDALLRSDARADQNQVIFFTSPNTAFVFQNADTRRKLK